MIIVHSYCSYKHSPVGFHYGSFIIDETDNIEADTEFYYLSYENNKKEINDIFEDGEMAGGYGKLPNSSNYVYIARKYKYDYDNKHSDTGRQVQLNLAFEFSDFDQFKRFSSNFSMRYKKTKISGRADVELADCLVPEREIIGSVKFNKKLLNNWLFSMINTEPSQMIFNNNAENFIKNDMLRLRVKDIFSYKTKDLISIAINLQDFTKPMRKAYSDIKILNSSLDKGDHINPEVVRELHSYCVNAIKTYNQLSKICISSAKKHNK